MLPRGQTLKHHAQPGKAVTKTACCVIVYRKYSEQANPEREKGEQWLPGADPGTREGSADGCEVSFRGDKNVLKLDGGKGCTAASMLNTNKLYIFTGCIYVGLCDFYLNKAAI